jgi:hypothetical protein
MTLSAIATKRRILEDAGYVYAFERAVYFNPVARKVLSIEFVEDHNDDELQECISENSGGVEWRFYFNSPPAPAVRRELVGVLR